MASTERSLGWATGVAGTDGAIAYDTARMSAMERAGLGVGVLITGSYLAMSGAATTTLTIADGAAIVGGIFYESNGAVTISTSALGSVTYTAVIIANTTGGSLTVSANGAGTTTVTTATTRTALVTAAQLATITTAITSANLVILGTVATTAGTIATITPYFPYANGRQQRAQQYCQGSGGTVSLGTAAFTPLVNYTAGVSSADGTITFTLVNGQISIYQSGIYLFDYIITFDTNTTGNRMGSIRNLGNSAPVTAALFATSAIYRGSVTAIVTVTPGTAALYYLEGWASNAGRSVTDSSITCTRL